LAERKRRRQNMAKHQESMEELEERTNTLAAIQKMEEEAQSNLRTCKSAAICWSLSISRRTTPTGRMAGR
jgi:hypothetical protein